MKPIIGIVPLVDQEKESLWMLPGYMEGIMEAGGIPVILPLTSDATVIRPLLDTVHGILLTGGHDVDPILYGEEKMPECGTICKERDENPVFKCLSWRNSVSGSGKAATIGRGTSTETAI